MTVVILYLTLPLEQLVRIYMPWVVTSNKYLYSTAEGGGGSICFFFLCDGGYLVLILSILPHIPTFVLFCFSFHNNSQ